MPRTHALQLGADMYNGAADEVSTPVGQRKSILTVDAATCHWPIGDPRVAGFHFCGAGTSGKSPYCVHHAQVAARGPAPAPIKWKLA